MKSVFKLLNSYYIKGFFGPFFVIVFPIILIFIVGNAMESNIIESAKKIANATGQNATDIANVGARNIISGIMITSLMSIGLISLPIMIIDFKKSTLIKRIGAAHISKKLFFTSVIGYNTLIAFFDIIWVLLWGGIIMGTKSSFNWSVAFDYHIAGSIPMMFLVFCTSMSIGLFIVALINTQQGVMGITNVIYFPISFLSGSFLPKQNIDSSTPLTIISYFLPTKYSVDPFFQIISHGISSYGNWGWKAYGYPLISITIIIIFIIVTIKKFKWSN